MFRAPYAHHQEANCIDAASGVVLSVSGRGPYQVLHQCNWPPDDEHIVLETCRGF